MRLMNMSRTMQSTAILTKMQRAQAIIDCFGDHNHYGNAGRSQLAGDLMLNGYGTTPGIVSELVRVLTESANRPCVKIEAEYDDNGTLVNLTTTPAKVSEAQKAERSKNRLLHIGIRSKI